MSNIPDDLLDLIEELVIIEEKTKKEREDYGERLYEELPLPRREEETKPHKIEISLE